jgi:dihydrofolate synthase/folylpolyglutamate synthase
MDAHELAKAAEAFGLTGDVVSNVNEALNVALKEAKPDDLIFVGGSTFVVAELNNL